MRVVEEAAWKYKEFESESRMSELELVELGQFPVRRVQNLTMQVKWGRGEVKGAKSQVAGWVSHMDVKIF